MKTLAIIALPALLLTGCAYWQDCKVPDGSASESDDGSSIIAFGLKEAAGQKPSDISDDTDSNYISHRDHR